jgi:hypothetical protein
MGAASYVSLAEEFIIQESSDGVTFTPAAVPSGEIVCHFLPMRPGACVNEYYGRSG